MVFQQKEYAVVFCKAMWDQRNPSWPEPSAFSDEKPLKVEQKRLQWLHWDQESAQPSGHPHHSQPEHLQLAATSRLDTSRSQRSCPTPQGYHQDFDVRC